MSSHLSERQNADEHLLHSHGYDQQLHRGLSLWSSFSVGFATVSPVVGIYSVMSLGAMNAGPSWVWIVPLCLALQLLVALVYAELASQYPNAGIVAEAIASIGIGVLLLLFFRNHSFALLLEGLSSTSTGDGRYFSGFLTAMAVGGWAFLGFDACSQVSEETADARTSTPRAILRSMILVGLTVMLTAFAVTLSYTDTAALVSGQVIDPVTPAVVDAFGAWTERPFVAVVLVAFIACVVSVQTYIGRAVFGMARDNILPASALLRRVDKRKVPFAAMVFSTLFASFGLALGLNATAVGTLIAFGSGGFFFVFLIVVTCALLARLNGTWKVEPGTFSLGRWGITVNVAAFVWLVFESINVAWPREALAPPDAPWFQVWAVILVFSSLALLGLIYLFWAKPYQRAGTPQVPTL